MKLILPILLVLSACARDLEVPAAPGATPEALGELSGIYGLAFAWTPPEGKETVEIPHSALMAIMHLEKPGADPEPVAGFIFDDVVDLDPSLPTTADLDPELFFGRTFRALYDGTHLEGEGRRFLAVSGERAPGGGALNLSLAGLGICPRGAGAARAPEPVRARRLCTFDPAISGVYRGEAGACGGEGPTRTSYLGLGFFEDAAIALRYPEEGEVSVLSYDLFTGAGLGLVLSETGYSAAVMQLADSGENLDLEMEVYALTGTCTERRSLRRLAGGVRNPECSLSTIPVTDLEYEARVTVEDGPAARRRFVDVRVFPTSAPTITLPPGLLGLVVELQATDDGRVRRVPDAEVPQGQTARFEVEEPARAAGEPTRYYEALVVRAQASSTGVDWSFAPLRCLRDRVAILP